MVTMLEHLKVIAHGTVCVCVCVYRYSMSDQYRFRQLHRMYYPRIKVDSLGLISGKDVKGL